jgi:hypothetical protein
MLSLPVHGLEHFGIVIEVAQPKEAENPPIATLGRSASLLWVEVS